VGERDNDLGTVSFADDCHNYARWVESSNEFEAGQILFSGVEVFDIKLIIWIGIWVELWYSVCRGTCTNFDYDANHPGGRVPAHDDWKQQYSMW
jgi:hypothetical protein